VPSHHPAEAFTCVAAANVAAEAALAQYRQHNPSRASSLYHQAALTLEECLKQNPSADTSASQQRLGEMWLYAGEMEAADGNSQTAVTFQHRAKAIFARLRAASALHGTELDEVLLDSHQADRDLTRQYYDIYNRRGNVEAMEANFDAAIADWRRAEELDEALTDDPDKKCRGEGQRVDIRAAQQAKQEAIQAHLTPTEAAAWFEKRNSELWIPDPCNGP
jgi:tetratricopeptide (TPR) repeat protein